MTTPPGPPWPEQPEQPERPDQAGQPEQPGAFPPPPPPPGYAPQPGPAYGQAFPGGGLPQGTAWGGPPTSEETTWGWIAHASSFLAGAVLGGLSFLGPLVVLLVKGKDSPFVKRHATEALNFQISAFIYLIASLITLFLLIGFVLVPALVVFWFVVTLIATIKAANGEEYRYPLSIRFVK